MSHLHDMTHYTHDHASNSSSLRLLLLLLLRLYWPLEMTVV
jgi:hypothetical protein